MSFIIKNNRVLDNYTEIWSKIKEILNIKFHSMSAYDEKYIKAKAKGSNGVVKPIFRWWNTKGKRIYAWIAFISIDSLIRMKKKELSTSLFRRMQIQDKKIKMSGFINAELELVILVLILNNCNFFYSQ